MRTLLLSLILITLVVSPAIAAGPRRPAAPEPQAVARSAPLDAVVAGCRGFTFALLKRLGTERGNAFFSPFSLSSALAMVSSGARGKTAAELARVLELPSEAGVHGSLGELARLATAAADTGGATLAIANGLWGQKGRPFVEGFVTLNSAHYGAGLNLVDFVKNPESARRAINRWVEHATRSKIRELLPPRSVTALTRLVLTNAIYFKGDWLYPFARTATAPGRFHPASGRAVEVPLMHRKGEYEYFESDDLQALELPYRGRGLSLWLLLPAGKTSLERLEGALTPRYFEDILARADSAMVQLTLPRFSCQTSYELADTLKAMGAPAAFSDGADFSGMTREPVKLDDVIHKACIEVTESGTEAAAASGVQVMRKGLMVPRTFTADRPFLYFVVDRRRGTILFAGRLADPRP